MSEYKDWLKNDKAKKHRIDMLKMSGIPLEMRLRKTLDDKGFIVAPYKYLDVGDNIDSRIITGDGVWRELDAWGLRQRAPSIDIGGIKISLFTHILCECKYSSERDIISFSDEFSQVHLSHLPVLVNGQEILGQNLHSDFPLPEPAERVIELSSGSESMKEGNFTDRNINEACEQLISALRYLIVTNRNSTRNTYTDMTRTSEIGKIWQNIKKSVMRLK